MDWQTGVIVPIFKRGARRVCSPQIQEEQCGFRLGCGTGNQLFTLARLLEESWEFAQPVYICRLGEGFRPGPFAVFVVGTAVVWGDFHGTDIWAQLGGREHQVRGSQDCLSDMVLLASLDRDLRHSLWRFVAERRAYS